MTKEQTIKNYMDRLDLSYEEACQLWDDDHSSELSDEQKELEKKAKLIKRYEKSDKKREKTTKERKIDPLKEAIIHHFNNYLTNHILFSTEIDDYCAMNIKVFNESKINFELCGENFTLTLTKHRKNKED